MVRVLVTVEPRIYREAVAQSIRRASPGAEVKVAPPDDAEGEIALFRPDLLVHDDTAGIAEGALAGVPCRVEMLYSDSMDARVTADGMATRLRDMSTEDLLRTVAVAASLNEPG
jgi:hypothetical protein